MRYRTVLAILFLVSLLITKLAAADSFVPLDCRSVPDVAGRCIIHFKEGSFSVGWKGEVLLQRGDGKHIFMLPGLRSRPIKDVWLVLYKDAFIFFTTELAPHGKSTIISIDKNSLKQNWFQLVDSQQLPLILRVKHSIYFGGTNFLGNLDLDSGKFNWAYYHPFPLDSEHGKKNIIKNFERPEINGDKVIFKAKVNNEEPVTVIVNNSNGDIYQSSGAHFERVTTGNNSGPIVYQYGDPCYLGEKALQTSIVEYLYYRAADDDERSACIVRKKIEHGVNPNETLSPYNWTPLHMAVQRHKIKTAHVLLDANVNVDIKDGNGRTPIFYTIGDTDLLDAILAKKPDLTAKDKDGMNVLLYYLDNAIRYYSKINTNPSASEVVIMKSVFKGRDPKKGFLSAIGKLIKAGSKIPEHSLAAQSILKSVNTSHWVEMKQLIQSAAHD